jgi:predicted GH43/DUF377 family glycosyl hydrolase
VASASWITEGNLIKLFQIMISVKKEGVLLKKTNLDFENEGVLNPAVIADQNGIHLFYRAVAKGNYSSIGYCRLKSPLKVESRLSRAVLFPEYFFESHGVEDPRIVKIDDLYYLTYTAYDGVNALGALAVSTDLQHFDKQGLLVPEMTYDDFNSLAESRTEIDKKYQRYNIHGGIHRDAGKKALLWNKNVVFFPRRINGKLYFIQRIRPDIQLVAVNSLKELTSEFWKEYFLHFSEHIVLTPKYPHEVSYIGGGCPPVETVHGWILIYHGVYDTIEGYVYSACAALLDLENPQKEIARLPYALFAPEYDWELKGEVNNVCFPTGTFLTGDTLYIYYGAADEQVACASVSISELVTELISNIKEDDK